MDEGYEIYNKTRREKLIEVKCPHSKALWDPSSGRFATALGKSLWHLSPESVPSLLSSGLATCDGVVLEVGS